MVAFLSLSRRHLSTNNPSSVPKFSLSLGNFMKLTHILSDSFLTHILSREAKMAGKPQIGLKGNQATLH